MVLLYYCMVLLKIKQVQLDTFIAYNMLGTLKVDMDL
jgi:hypothetical protein